MLQFLDWRECGPVIDFLNGLIIWFERKVPGMLHDQVPHLVAAFFQEAGYIQVVAFGAAFEEMVFIDLDDPHAVPVLLEEKLENAGLKPRLNDPFLWL
jgi:hypothetical protein